MCVVLHSQPSIEQLSATLSAAGVSIPHNYPARACAERGYVIGRGVYIYILLYIVCNQTFISQNTHFQRSILTQIGFSSNLMASGIA